MKTIVLSLLLTIFMTGCFNNEPPKCSDDDVQETLKSIYTQVLENVQNSGNPFLAGFTKSLPQGIQSLSSIRPVAYDEAVKIRSCKAEALFDNNQTAAIEYTVQTNEENSDDFYVELNTEFLEGLMQQSIMQGIFNK
jgi:hypothetical protein